MKDQALILGLDFGKIDAAEIKKAMIKSGWVIKESSVSFKPEGFKVTVFESKEEYDWNEKTCSYVGRSYDEAFVECLKEIQKYYNRVI